jgi:hypothetical protein
MNQQIDDLTKKASEIYAMFCLPRISLYTTTGKTEISYVWKNEEARILFENLQNEISRQIVEFRGREAVEHIRAADGYRASAFGGSATNDANAAWEAIHVSRRR